MFPVPVLVVALVIFTAVGSRTPMPPNLAGTENNCFHDWRWYLQKWLASRTNSACSKIGMSATFQLGMILCGHDHSKCIALDSAEKAAWDCVLRIMFTHVVPLLCRKCFVVSESPFHPPKKHLGNLDA